MIHALWAEDEIARNLVRELESARAVRNFSATIRTCAGEIRDVVVAAENLELGSAPYYLLILQDITDRMRLENELRQSQKMEAVGRLAAGVAHDFNNILTVILGNTSLQLRNPGLDEKLTSSLQQVVQAAQRATALTRQLLAYSRKQIIQRRPLAAQRNRRRHRRHVAPADRRTHRDRDARSRTICRRSLPTRATSNR